MAYCYILDSEQISDLAIFLLCLYIILYSRYIEEKMIRSSTLEMVSVRKLDLGGITYIYI